MQHPASRMNLCSLCVCVLRCRTPTFSLDCCTREEEQDFKAQLNAYEPLRYSTASGETIQKLINDDNKSHKLENKASVAWQIQAANFIYRERALRLLRAYLSDTRNQHRVRRHFNCLTSRHHQCDLLNMPIYADYIINSIHACIN